MEFSKSTAYYPSFPVLRTLFQMWPVGISLGYLAMTRKTFIYIGFSSVHNIQPVSQALKWEGDPQNTRLMKQICDTTQSACALLFID